MPTTDYIWEVTTPDTNLHKLKDAESMHYRGTLGTGGDITVLPTASASNKGDTYKVITDGTYAGQEAKAGDLFISDGSSWILISGSGGSGEDTKVTQTATTTDANYEILFSETADNTTRTEGARKAATLRFNPSKGSIMEGNNTVASGTNSHAEGYYTTASGEYSHAEGNDTCASGDYSHVEGYMTTASIDYSHAEGVASIASGMISHAEGSGSTASGMMAHAEGCGTCATGYASHAESNNTKAIGNSSHAEGFRTTALGAQSHASGSYTCAAGEAQTVVGKYNIADTTSLFIVGNGTGNNAKSNALLVASDGTTTLGASGTITSGNTQAVTGGAVYDALQALPEPMVFRGTLGTDGTITTLPVDGTATVGDTYKVITAGTYDSKAAKVGDTFICRTKTSRANTWELIPSGDEPSGTVTNVAVSNGGGLSVSGSPITTSGTITISHADTSSQASVSNTGRTYIQSVTLDTYGHVTGLSSATETVTNTTYTFAGGTNKITVTPSNASAQDVNITVNDSTKLPLAGGTLTGRVTTTKALNDIITGTGTAAQDRGSGDDRYVPAKWTFNTGLTATNGDIVVVKVPVDGHDYGTYMSIDNGTTYYAVNSINATRLTTQYPTGNYVALIFDSNATTSMYPLNGGTTRSNVTGAWRVFNNYDSGNSDTYNRNRYQATIKADSNGIAVNNIAVGNSSGIFSQLNKGLPFDIDQPILFVERAIAANGTDTKNYDITALAITTTQNITLTAYLPVYIKGTLSGKIFTPVSTTPLTQIIPTSADNYYYMLLGRAYSTTQIYLQEVHPIFAYTGGSFREVVGAASFATNAGRDSDGNAINTTYVKKSGDAMTGQLFLKGSAASKPLKTRGIIGVTTDGTAEDALHIQYGNTTNDTINLGATSGASITNNGTQYSGNAATATNASKVNNHTVETDVPSGAVFTDTKVTSTANHYTPATVSGQDKSASASGATAAWSIDVVKGVTLNTDGKGHVTGISVTSGKIPANPLPSNNITGSGTSGYIAKFNGTNTITNGPAFGSATTTYLRNDGTWATPPNDNTDTKVTQTATTINANYEVLFSATADNTTRTEGAGKTSTLLYNPNTAKLSGMFGVQATELGVSASNGTTGGISLYNGVRNNGVEEYGIAFRSTSNMGKHGYVQGDWATYFTMNNAANRGWVFRRYNDTTNVASISNTGNAAFSGSVTVGSNAANTSGVRMVYDVTNECMNLEFAS